MYKYFKRFFDILIAIFALICLSWVFIICMIILLCTGEHYIFYCQKRMGKNGKPFKIIKFATMLFNSPNMPGGTITRRNDPRVLPFGRFLRMTKINEFPQLFNVLNGTMSIVGPRPLVEASYNSYPQSTREAIYSINPGVTGVGSIVFRDEEKYLSQTDDPFKFYNEMILPFKGDLELWYLKNMSLSTDIKVIFLTFWAICFPTIKIHRKILKNLPPKPDWV